jgi:hypothetical protein
MAAREIGDGARRDAVGEVGLGQDAQPGVLLGADRVGDARDFFETGQDVARAFIEAQAFLGRDQAAPLAQEQRKADFILERRDQAADLRLRAVDAVRGFGDAAGLEHGAQRLQAVQAHRDKPRQAARGGRARTGACPRAGRPGGGNALQKRMNQYSKRN